MSEKAASWAAWVRVLAPGPEPELREFLECHHTGMGAATRCGYCWRKLLPLAPADGAGAVLAFPTSSSNGM